MLFVVTPDVSTIVYTYDDYVLNHPVTFLVDDLMGFETDGIGADERFIKLGDTTALLLTPEVVATRTLGAVDRNSLVAAGGRILLAGMTEGWAWRRDGGVSSELAWPEFAVYDQDRGLDNQEQAAFHFLAPLSFDGGVNYAPYLHNPEGSVLVSPGVDPAAAVWHGLVQAAGTSQVQPDQPTPEMPYTIAHPETLTAHYLAPTVEFPWADLLVNYSYNTVVPDELWLDAVFHCSWAIAPDQPVTVKLVERTGASSIVLAVGDGATVFCTDLTQAGDINFYYNQAERLTSGLYVEVFNVSDNAFREDLLDQLSASITGSWDSIYTPETPVYIAYDRGEYTFSSSSETPHADETSAWAPDLPAVGFATVDSQVFGFGIESAWFAGLSGYWSAYAAAVSIEATSDFTIAVHLMSMPAIVGELELRRVRFT